MTTIYLVGVKHSGKSTLGKRVAQLLPSVHFVDTDDLIVQKVDRSVRDFYASEGKEAFWSVEYNVTKEYVDTFEGNFLLVATGGGVVDNKPLFEYMRKEGTLLYLWVDKEVAFQRIVANGLPPFLDKASPKESFYHLFLHRDALYRKFCDYMVELYDYQNLSEQTLLLKKQVEKIIEDGHICRKIPLEQP